MNIEITPLDEDEKKILRKILYLRLGFGVLFVLPMLGLLGVVINDLVLDSSSVWGNFIGVVLLILMVFGFVKFLIPFYVKSFRNVKTENKYIVTTYISKINKRWTRYGYTYTVITDYMVIDSWINPILKRNLTFDKMFPGMTIEIHHLENNQFDILQLAHANLNNH